MYCAIFFHFTALKYQLLLTLRINRLWTMHICW